MQFHELVDPKGIAKDVTNVGRWGNGDVEIGFSDLAQLPYIMGLIRQAFENRWRARWYNVANNTSSTGATGSMYQATFCLPAITPINSCTCLCLRADSLHTGAATASVRSRRRRVVGR